MRKFLLNSATQLHNWSWLYIFLCRILKVFPSYASDLEVQTYEPKLRKYQLHLSVHFQPDKCGKVRKSWRMISKHVIMKECGHLKKLNVCKSPFLFVCLFVWYHNPGCYEVSITCYLFMSEMYMKCMICRLWLTTQTLHLSSCLSTFSS